MISGEGLGPWPLRTAQRLISELSWAAGRDQSDHCGQLFLCPKSLLGAARDVATDSRVSVTPTPSSGQWLHTGLQGIRNKRGIQSPGKAPGSAFTRQICPLTLTVPTDCHSHPRLPLIQIIRETERPQKRALICLVRLLQSDHSLNSLKQ